MLRYTYLQARDILQTQGLVPSLVRSSIELLDEFYAEDGGKPIVPVAPTAEQLLTGQGQMDQHAIYAYAAIGSVSMTDAEKFATWFPARHADLIPTLPASVDG